MNITIKEIEKKTICLNMIVKNEAHIICTTFDNLTTFFNFDYYVICDTGSNDGTQKKIVEYFEKLDISGEIHECEWKDFGYNRTEALGKAYNKTDYLLIFDADDKINGNFEVPCELTNDIYHLQFGDSNGKFVYKRPLLLNNRKKYKYEGILHEFLVPIDQPITEKLIKGNYGVESGRTGDRSKDPDKYKKDAKILEDAFYNKENEGLKHRYAFYCAQSYRDSRNIDKAIEWYEKTLTLNNLNQEKYYSSLQLGSLYKQKNETEKALFYWLKTMEYDNDRIEGVIAACNEYSSRGMHHMIIMLYNNFKNYKSKIDDLCEKLFVDITCYNNLLEFYCSASAQYAGKSRIGYEACKEFLITNTQDTHITALLLFNFQFYMQYYSDDLDLELFYSVDNIISKFDNVEDHHIKIWKFMFDKIKHKLTQKKELLDIRSNPMQCEKPWIIITFTTCKRFDLFKQTLNSLLNNWEDYNKIDYWFCVDDNSSKEDREKMKEQFPWIDYYMKDLNEKGHRKSMNIIWDKLNTLKPKYWIHMEDDFLFHRKMPYIKKGIEGLTKFKNENIKQILFNRNYAEIISEYGIKGHKKLSDEFSIHDHNHEQHSYPNCHYWPHYSFRPAIIDVETILSLGNFDSENQFFEMDYAKCWYNNGYASGFFNFITNKHIGRLTSERNDIEKKNAYELNNEGQFAAISHYIKVVNLERRLDRKENIMKKLKDNNIDLYEFVKAVDGKTLQPTLELKELFKGNDFGNRQGVIGCALSHYKLWKQLLEDKNNEFYIILEDDLTLCKDFNQKLESIKSEFSQKELIFLGYSMFEKERHKVKDIYNSEESGINIQTLNKNLYIGGFFSYTINKSGAQFLVDYINDNGIKHGIDYLIKISDINAYECVPQLIFSEWNEDGKKIDTDIQNDYTSVDFSKIKDDFIFIPQQDQFGHDLYCNRKPLLEMKDMALNINNCIAFNTLGFFKRKIENLTSSKYFGSTDGIYIKKEYYEKYQAEKEQNKSTYRVKMLCNWCSSEQLCKEWSVMCEEGLRWKDIEITSEDENIDYYVIINKPPPNAHYIPEKTIIFQMEPWVEDISKNWGVKTWGEWSTPDPTKFLEVRGRKTEHHNNAFWQLELPLPDIIDLKYDKIPTISSICSSKYFDVGHIHRVDFLKFLESKGDIPLDIFNQDNKHNFTNYRGKKTPYIDKSTGIVPYKYYFMVENNYERNFITEKLWESILCETLIFYYGCPNIKDYINEKAFVQLDMNDFEKSYEIIKKAIKEDWWSQRIDIIRAEKKKLLNEMSFFPTLDKIIKNNSLKENLDIKL